MAQSETGLIWTVRLQDFTANVLLDRLTSITAVKFRRLLKLVQKDLDANQNGLDLLETYLRSAVVTSWQNWEGASQEFSRAWRDPKHLPRMKREERNAILEKNRELTTEVREAKRIFENLKSKQEIFEKEITL